MVNTHIDTPDTVSNLNTHPHLEEALQKDIEIIRGKVNEMAILNEQALKTSLHALTNRERQSAYSVILRDRLIDELETEIDRLCLQFLVRHQPVASQLRFVFSTILINRELERIGDYAESVARQVLQLGELEPHPPYDNFIELGNLAVHMLRDAVQSFLRQDAALALRTMPIEERANTMRNSINAEIKELSQSGRLPAASVLPLLTVARRLERVTDQAKNLCEEVLYMCTGEFAKHKNAEQLQLLFVDAHNSCLSQMAEGIGKTLAGPGLSIGSAGLMPQPIDTWAVSFMAAKGIDISQQTAKSLDQLPASDLYNIVVALNRPVKEALAGRPVKTVVFTWAIKDPLESEGTPDEVRADFEAAYRALDTQIKELVAAIRQEPQPNSRL